MEDSQKVIILQPFISKQCEAGIYGPQQARNFKFTLGYNSGCIYLIILQRPHLSIRYAAARRSFAYNVNELL
jgi:hypothetical protein